MVYCLLIIILLCGCNYIFDQSAFIGNQGSQWGGLVHECVQLLTLFVLIGFTDSRSFTAACTVVTLHVFSVDNSFTFRVTSDQSVIAKCFPFQQYLTTAYMLFCTAL